FLSAPRFWSPDPDPELQASSFLARRRHHSTSRRVTPGHLYHAVPRAHEFSGTPSRQTESTLAGLPCWRGPQVFPMPLQRRVGSASPLPILPDIHYWRIIHTLLE